MPETHEYRVFAYDLDGERVFDEKRQFPGIRDAWTYVIDRTVDLRLDTCGAIGPEV